MPILSCELDAEKKKEESHLQCYRDSEKEKESQLPRKKMRVKAVLLEE
jgi:hypothetical protein